MAQKRSIKKKKSRSSPKPESGFLFRNNLGYKLLLILLGFLFFSPVFTADFLNLDDQTLILDNMIAFESDPGKIFRWGFLTPHYKPVVFLSWMMEYKLFGPNPFVYHLNNLLLHIFNSLLVFLVFLKLVPQFKTVKTYVVPVAFFTAVIFMLNPMHVESVAWATERKDVLYVFFFLLSLYTYLIYLKQKNNKLLILSALLFIPSLLCKAPAICLPFILFLVDFVFKRPFNKKIAIEKIGHFIVLVAALGVYGFFSTDYSEGSIGSIASGDILTTAPALAGIPTSIVRIVIASLKTVLWFLHILVPVKLSIAYPREPLISFFGHLVYLFPFVVAGFFLILFKVRRTNRLIFFSFFFFLFAMTPAIIRIYPGIGIFLSDRYTYLGSLGIIFLVVSFIVLWMQRRKFGVRSIYYILGFIALLSGIYTYKYARVWQNPEKLWTNTIEKYPNVAYAFVNRGGYYRQQGEYQKGLDDLNRALNLEQEANSYVQRGLIYRQMGRPQEALSDYQKAIELEQDNTQAKINRGNAFLDLGRFQEAIVDYNEALEIDPDNVRVLANRAAAYGNLRRYDAAKRDLEVAESLDPDYIDIYINRMVMSFELQDFETALNAADKLLVFNPNDHQSYSDRGVALMNLSRHQEAIESFSRAIQLSSTQGAYYQNRARAYQFLGNQAAAQKDLETAASLR
jgi:tetratricopeptide (TPR) repeat protein